MPTASRPRPVPEGAGESARRNPVALALAALVALQGIGLIAAGVYLVVRAQEPHAGHPGSTTVLGVLSALVGLVVIAMARAALRLSGRVRSPLLVLEILCLPIGLTAVQGGRWQIGVPLALVAVAVIVLMGLAGLFRTDE